MKNSSKLYSHEYLKKNIVKSFSVLKRISEQEKGWNNRIIACEQILGVVPREYSNKKFLPQQMNQQELKNLIECEQKIFTTKLEQVRQVHKLYNVPKIHQNVFNQILASSDDKQIILEEELKLMDQKLSPILHCMFTITARDNCLNYIFSLLKQHQFKDQEKLKELIYDLRILQLNALESIVKWQQYIEHKILIFHFVWMTILYILKDSIQIMKF